MDAILSCSINKPSIVSIFNLVCFVFMYACIDIIVRRILEIGHGITSMSTEWSVDRYIENADCHRLKLRSKWDMHRLKTKKHHGWLARPPCQVLRSCVHIHNFKVR